VTEYEHYSIAFEVLSIARIEKELRTLLSVAGLKEIILWSFWVLTCPQEIHTAVNTKEGGISNTIYFKSTYGTIIGVKAVLSL